MYKEDKFIIFWQMLLVLFSWLHCKSCGAGDISYQAKRIASLLSVTFTCTACSLTWLWNSQHFIGSFPAGNILLSASILFTGVIAKKVLQSLRQIAIAVPADRIYFLHQEQILCPSIEKLWVLEQESYIGYLCTFDFSVSPGGDGRADSSGHSAKYGTYTMISLDLNAVID